MMLLRLLKMTVAVFAGLSGLATAAFADTAGSCGGKNLIDELAKTDKAAFERIRAKAAKTINSGALFWKVEKDGIAPSWLLGTAHVTDQRVTALPADIRKALEAASTVALEIIDMSEAAVGAAMMKSPDLAFFTDGRQLGTMLTADEFQKLSGYVRAAGVPSDLLQGFKPWMVATLLALSPCEMAKNSSGLPTLDDVVEQTAKDRGIARVGLETIEEQFRAMSDMSMDAQVANLKMSIELYHRIDDSMETLNQLYLSRRIAEMFPLLEEMSKDYPEQAKLAFSEFQLELIDKRNRRMHERALPLIEKGNAFIAVGALHLPGDVGLVELLAKDGYKLTPVN